MARKLFMQHPQNQQNLPPMPVQANDEVSIGEVLNQRFQIESLLGRGGMATVYRAIDLRTERAVAIKVLHSEVLRDQVRVQRFWQEAKTYRNLRHKNIIKIFEFFTDEVGRHCLVMEYLEGQNLSEVLDQVGQLDIQRALKIFKQIASALDHAHKTKIVHRDLKPSNICIMHKEEEQDFVKVLDFGIAKLMPEGEEDIAKMALTQTGEIVGSPLYMSPEQCMAKTIDNRSDIYSFGCLMYEAMTGQPPLLGGNVYETFHMQTAVRPKPISELRDGLEPDSALEMIILKCMAKKPGNRYQAMEQVIEDLDKVNDPPETNSVKKGLTLVTNELIKRRAEKGKGIPPHIVAGVTAVIIVSGVVVFQDNIRRVIEPAEHRYIQYSSEYRKALDNLNYGGAEQSAMKALDVAEKEKPEFLVPALTNLVDLQRITNMLPEAERNNKRILSLAGSIKKDTLNAEKKLKGKLKVFSNSDEKVENPDEIEDVCYELNDVAVSYMDKEMWDKAEKLLKDTKAAAIKILGEQNLVVVTLNDNLALLKFRNNIDEKYSELETTLTEAANAHEEVAGKESAGLIPVLSALSEVERREEKFAAAEKNAQRCLTLARNAYRSSSIQAVLARCQIAKVYNSEKKYFEARTVLNPAVAVVDQNKNIADDDKAAFYTLMGDSLLGLEKVTEAEQKYNRAYELLGKDPHLNPLMLSDVYTGLGNLYMSRAKYKSDVAEVYYKRALAAAFRSTAREQAQVLYLVDKISQNYRQTGRTSQLEDLYKMLVTVDKSTGKTMAVIEDNKMLGNFYLEEQQRVKEALNAFEDALTLSQNFYGSESPQTCEIMGMLASTYLKAKNTEQAGSLIEKAAAIVASDNVGPKVSRAVKLQVLSTYAKYLGKTGNTEKLEQVKSEIEKL